MQKLIGYEGQLWARNGQDHWEEIPSFSGDVKCYPVGELDHERYQIVIPDSEHLPAAYDFEPLNLRQRLSECKTEEEYVLYARAVQIATWHHEHQFCGRCGSSMASHEVDLAKHCPRCDLIQYPRISPCVIVLVLKGDKCLLARSPRFPPGRFSTLAGFIEAGETAEAAVAREIKEEVGIDVTNVRYLKSQSWPFPHSLMLGFFADYAGGEIQVDGVEIEEAHWYTRETMPDLPPSFAISWTLIEAYMKDQVPK